MSSSRTKKKIENHHSKQSRRFRYKTSPSSKINNDSESDRYSLADPLISNKFKRSHSTIRNQIIPDDEIYRKFEKANLLNTRPIKKFSHQKKKQKNSDQIKKNLNIDVNENFNDSEEIEYLVEFEEDVIESCEFNQADSFNSPRELNENENKVTYPSNENLQRNRYRNKDVNSKHSNHAIHPVSQNEAPPLKLFNQKFQIFQKLSHVHPPNFHSFSNEEASELHHFYQTNNQKSNRFKSEIILDDPILDYIYHRIENTSTIKQFGKVEEPPPTTPNENYQKNQNIRPKLK